MCCMHTANSRPGRHWAKACGSQIFQRSAHHMDIQGSGPQSEVNGSSHLWGKVAVALLVSELMRLFLAGVPPALCRCRMSGWHGTPFREHVRMPFPEQRKEASLGMGWQKPELWGDGPSAHLLTAKTPERFQARAAWAHTQWGWGWHSLPCRDLVRIAGLLLPTSPGARDVPTAAPTTEEVPVWTWFLAAKPKAEQLRGSVAPGLPHSQLSGLREVGAQTTCGLDRPEAEKPQGNSHPYHSTSFVKTNKSRNWVRKSWPLNSTPPSKLRHPGLVCSQDTLLALDLLNLFLSAIHNAKVGKTYLLYSLPSKPASLSSEASGSQTRTLR